MQKRINGAEFGVRSERIERMSTCLMKSKD